MPTAQLILEKISELQEVTMLRDHARCVNRRKDMRSMNRGKADGSDLGWRASAGERLEFTGGDEDGMSM